MMKSLLFASVFILSGFTVFTQNEAFLVNKEYLDNLSRGQTTGLIEVACMAIRVRPDGSNLKVREYYAMDNYGWIDASNYKTFTYRYDSGANAFVLRCSTSEGSGLFGHSHTDGGYHWIKVDDFGDYLLLKNCGVAKAVNKFVVANPGDYMR